MRDFGWQAIIRQIVSNRASASIIRTLDREAGLIEFCPSVRERSTVVCSLFLSMLLLLLQFAGSSPALHGYLHGENTAASTCCDHTSSGDEGSDESEACDESCVVLTFAGGITLAPVFAVEANAPRAVALCQVAGPIDIIEEYRSSESARAPPGL